MIFLLLSNHKMFKSPHAAQKIDTMSKIFHLLFSICAISGDIYIKTVSAKNKAI